jgi:hypothetical protein
MKILSGILVIVTIMCSSGVRAGEDKGAETDRATAADRVQLDQTVISGNQELPKVLYILPWQKSDARPALRLDAGLEDTSIFKRVEPTAYRRELAYRNALERMGEAGSTGRAEQIETK